VSAIRKVDFYLYSLEELRNKLSRLIRHYIRYRKVRR